MHVPTHAKPPTETAVDDQQQHHPRFAVDERGAVTVDWVVLTAAIIGLGFLIVAPIAGGTDSLATAARDTIADVTVTLDPPTDNQ